MEHLAMLVERTVDVLREARETGMLQRHWEELALDQEEVPLSPDWGRYWDLECQGALSTIAVRERSRLVGYSIMVLTTGLHYDTCAEARMDIFWIAPEVRGRYGGVRLFRAHERELRRRGVRRVYVGSKLHRDSSRLFLRLGYLPVETWFSKMLTAEN
jgi:GNAT superfamily N-acetyltransferase